jgi:hypothetical protein
MLCTPFRLTHGGRGARAVSPSFCSALSYGGHTRFMPAWTLIVGLPHAEQNWSFHQRGSPPAGRGGAHTLLRLFQSINDLA